MAYAACVSAEECGPFADCSRFKGGTRTCGRRCTRDVDCPPPPSGVTARCDTTLVRPVCILECTGPGACPYGLACVRYEDGRYGYCS
ncbi:MAG: hypothetical protein U0324_46245 [Polyangiales bacterium]